MKIQLCAKYPGEFIVYCNDKPVFRGAYWRCNLYLQLHGNEQNPKEAKNV